MLRGIATDVVPRGFGADENMHFYLNTGVAVDGTQGHAMHLPFMRTTECRPAGFAEA